MKQAFFLVSALFVLFQISAKVSAAPVESSSESDQQTVFQNIVDRIIGLFDRLLDLLDDGVDTFQTKYDNLHKIVSGIIKAHEPSDDAPEILKTAVKNFETFFDDGHAKVMDVIDQYQKQGGESIDSLKEKIKGEMDTTVSKINAAKKSLESSTA